MLMTIDNEITLFDWYNTLSAHGVMNVGYDYDVTLMNIMFGLTMIDW